MKIIVRTDASIKMGSGHVMRCLTLAEALKNQGAQVEFICREHNGSLISLINDKGFYVYGFSINHQESYKSKHSSRARVTWKEDAENTFRILKEIEADWLIVDHYDLGIQWEQSLRSLVKKIMVIDDLANRQHDCDVLLDQNLYLKLNRYEGLIPSNCLQLIGLDYLLMRQEFIKARQKLIRTRKNIKRILVFFGASDISNGTCKTLAAIKELKNKKLSIDIVVGSENKHQKEIRKIIVDIPNTKLHIQIEYMAVLMASADLFIGAGGSVTWERCFLELPAIVITLAENQIQAAKDLEEKGIIYYLGNLTNVDKFDILKAILFFLKSPQVAEKISKKCHNLVDGLGTQRVVKALVT